MKNRNLLLGLVDVINSYSLIAFANDEDISSPVKNYTYKYGVPDGLSQVYSVDAPDAGFPPTIFL